MILLDEDKYNEDKKVIKKSDKNKEKIINNDIIFKKYNDEIDYVNSLIDYTTIKLLKFNPNINNNLDILEQKININILNKNNNNNSNNNINENLNLISEKHEQNTKVEPINKFGPNFVFQILGSCPELNTNKNINYNNQLFQIDNKQSKKDKKDSFPQEKKEDEIIFLNEGLINFLNNGNNQNEIDLELKDNNKFNLRKESFMSDLDNLFNNCDKDNLFE